MNDDISKTDTHWCAPVREQGVPVELSSKMYELYSKFQALLATCTASASPGSPDSLITAVCYDSKGCCSDDSTQITSAMTQSRAEAYTQCVAAAGSPEEKLACTSQEVAISG